MQKQLIIPRGLSREIIEQIGWTPALKLGNEVIISAIGGVTHPQPHIFSVGDTIEDQISIIIDHFEDIMEQAEGHLDHIVEITVFVRPYVSKEDMKLAGKRLSQYFTLPSPTETWIVTDFAGTPEELVQVRARAIIH